MGVGLGGGGVRGGVRVGKGRGKSVGGLRLGSKGARGF